MKLFFSGGNGLKTTPEALIPRRNPHVLLSFHNWKSKGMRDRLRAFCAQKRGDSAGELGYGSLFIDSGAFSLYNEHVRGGHRYAIPRRNEDFAFYSLKKGSKFRAYCDSYARFVNNLRNVGARFRYANLDVIHNPDLTRQAQQYLEQEHGLKPVPVVHALTDMRHVRRYLEAGRYGLLGVGGLGQNISKARYRTWGDKLFKEICPATNDYQPIIRTHLFAMTSSELIHRWPLWSVDSATWIKLAANGHVYLPCWSESEEKWDFTKPFLLKFSMKPPKKRRTRQKHFASVRGMRREIIHRWLDRWGLDEDDLAVNWIERARANLHYFKSLEQSRPKWPHRLDETITRKPRISTLLPDEAWL
ncbi:MAG: hypothetical protein AB9869_32820 [Verrucomicrobiia bacterium]